MGGGGTVKPYRVVVTISVYVDDYDTGNELAQKIISRLQTDPDLDEGDLGTTVNVNPRKPPGA
jgi:hypothetical protein